MQHPSVSRSQVSSVGHGGNMHTETEVVAIAGLTAANVKVAKIPSVYTVLSIGKTLLSYVNKLKRISDYFIFI